MPQATAAAEPLLEPPAVLFPFDGAPDPASVVLDLLEPDDWPAPPFPDPEPDPDPAAGSVELPFPEPEPDPDPAPDSVELPFPEPEEFPPVPLPEEPADPAPEHCFAMSWWHPPACRGCSRR